MSKFTETQLQFVAHGIAQGLDHSVMRESSGLTQHMLNKLIAKDISKQQLVLYENFLERAESRVALATVRHIAEMTEMSPLAYTVINESMERDSRLKHPELASRNAWKVIHNADAPVKAEKVGLTAGVVANIQVNSYGEEKTNRAIDTFVSSVEATTAQEMITPLKPVGEPSRHIRTSEAEIVTERTEDPLNEEGV